MTKISVFSPCPVPSKIELSRVDLRDLHRFSKNRRATAGLVIVTLFILTAIFADIIAPYKYTEQDYEAICESPSLSHPLGTDGLGRDMLSRIIYGSRISLTVGILVQFIVFFIGVPLGIAAGYYGGKVDTFVINLINFVSAFPRLLFIILIMMLLGQGLTNIFVAIGLTGWVEVCRLTRGRVLSVKEEEFVTACRALGYSNRKIFIKHIFPNCVTPIIISVTLGIPGAIFAEAGLSFIGIGVPPTTPSWGQMIGQYVPYIQSYWFLSFFPALMIALTMLGFTLLGDGLRDALDPRMR